MTVRKRAQALGMLDPGCCKQKPDEQLGFPDPPWPGMLREGCIYPIRFLS